MTTIVGLAILNAGFKRQKAFHIAKYNFLTKGQHENLSVKTIPIDPNTNQCKIIEIFQFETEVTPPLYAGSKHVKIPIGGSTDIVERKICRAFVHNLPRIDLSNCEIVGDFIMTSKVYDFASLKTKLKNKYQFSLNKLNINANLLKLYESDNLSVVNLIGYYHNDVFIAKFGGIDKSHVIDEACYHHYSGVNLIICGIFATIIGFYVDMSFFFEMI